MRPDLLSMLNIRHPIIQAPMAGISTPALAAAVSEAGGLGSIAVGTVTPAQAKAAIAAVRALTSRPFNVNVFTHAPAASDPAREAAWLEWLRPHFERFGAQPPAALKEIYRSFLDDAPMFELLLEERPAVVSFHFGLPPQAQIDALKAAGIVLFTTATSLDEALQIEAAGIDVIVAQGIEAGGHRGIFDPSAPDAGLGTFALLEQLRGNVKLPLVAAGGIMNGIDIRAAFSHGASAVQMGSAFIACPESSAPPHHRALITAGGTLETAHTAAISGRSARGIVNRLFTEVGAAGHPPLPDYPTTYDAAKALHAAASAAGNQDYSVNWGGSNFAQARSMPAGELVAALVAEMNEQA
ncbi:NAD(P)H-dependent flavin oxidoreductase [Massilia yuzhufengensis]|uniref:Nitronate monooxygenase n=1 Tax=Massilia yuzhufengensis TaxID=1164594 RepID=A0A1I1DEE1_9BURK|nr:nitronate monooxygenase [Massilia yuzhufengensis]SFB71438.1 nitronate monooxygenase [Massilia yuzhufengensis]